MLVLGLMSGTSADGSDAVLAGDVIIVAGEKMARQIACSLPIDDTNCGLSCDRAE